MTLDEFKEKMAEHAGQFHEEYDGCIRLGSDCPLAVIFGTFYIDASSKVGMSDRDQRAIMNAADGDDGALRYWMLATLCTSPAARP